MNNEVIFIKLPDGKIKYFDDYINALKFRFKYEWNNGSLLEIKRIQNTKTIN